ncbi:MAG: S9 family peptidase [Acidobacteria bacterium]|nr:MAG: S9 family peptidase [Acidobacteriota bacterium]REK02272.1 MAG: S9 family peptidase [Acidobacteriota bacterium]REK13925.1 MAG: S9 family peptidase [Acidobacteriota bacterium]REK41919.1 MAG: S9 family peptidase [Acidobacteriota bacterium]
MSLRLRGIFPAFLVLTLLVQGIIAQQSFDYPKSKKVDQVDDYHGTKVADPYRWLEDPDSSDSRSWIEAQNKLTFSYLKQLPQRKALEERLTELWNYERYSAPFKEGGKYFYFKNDGLQNQSVLYVAESPDDPGRVLLDPNKFSKDGTIALSGLSITEDGKTLAYGISKGGSDWREFKFMDIDSGRELPDHLRHIKFSGVSWTKDGKGVYYSRFPEPNEDTKLEDANFHRKLYYHELGTAQSEDKLIYERPDDPKLGISGFVTDDGEWLLIYLSDGTSRKNQVYYQSLTLKDAPIVPLIDKFENQFSYIGNDGAVFYFETDKDAPLGRVVSVNLLARTRVWNEVIPQAEETLRGISFINNQFVANYLKDAYTQIKIFNKDGSFVRNVELPGIGSAGGFGGKKDDSETFYTFSSYNAPPTIYRYDMKSGKSTLFRRAEVDFDPDAFEVKQVFYPSKDGTKIPMFIVHKKGIKLDGTNPTLLYGYGGFNIPMTPGFSTSRLVWLEMGGVYAVANLRGGGEYGEKWHQAGTKLKKQNVFDDFISAAEYLIENDYTSSDKLAIQGGSNGGLLVGAVLNQRPDLFGAALPAVGVMDMLRFHKFTIGWAWVSDYGSSENPEEFKALYAYSPIHNIKKGTEYPAVLITTADHDDRVVPAHSFKYAATIQEAQAGDAPVLIRIETDAGHGAGKPTSKIIEELADTYAFLMHNLGVE